MSTVFRSLEVRQWRQFDEVSIDFHPRLTILTGANAAGKTTLLGLLGTNIGWTSQYVATPKKHSKSGALSFLTGLFGRRQTEPQQDGNIIGEIRYMEGGDSYLSLPHESASANYAIQHHNLQPISGLFIPSHRPAFSYSPVTQIPTTATNRAQVLDQYLADAKSRWQGGSPGHTPVFRLKEALISMAMFGYGNRAVAENPEIRMVYEGFVETLRRVLPPSMGFEEIEIRMPEVILITKSGEFPIDAVSGGVASIIDLAFQIYMFESSMGKFVVVVDEPENHLHPELQRTLLPGFLDAFPRVQFIVATHSPFVVGSVPNSNVYVLRYHDPDDLPYGDEPTGQPLRTVYSSALDTVNRAGSSNEILREVLGLETTMPVWVESELDRLVTKHSGQSMTRENLEQLRSELNQLGMGETLPRAIDEWRNIDSAD